MPRPGHSEHGRLFPGPEDRLHRQRVLVRAAENDQVLFFEQARFAADPSSAYLLARNVRLLIQPTARQSYALFHTSNIYLALVLLMACLDAVL